MFAERQQPQQEEELHPPLEVGRLQADAAHQQVDPLVGRELAPAAAVLLQIERGDLDGLQALDPEGAFLALLLLVVLVPDVHLRPDAAHQQSVVVPQVMLRDVDVLVAEVHQLGPMLVVFGEVAHLHLVDEGVLALVLHHRLCLVRFVGPDEVRGQRVVDDPQPGVDSGGVVGGAVFPQEVLKDEDRDVGPDLHLAHQVLADHLARKHRGRLLIQLRHGFTTYIDTATSILSRLLSSAPVVASSR